MQSNMTWLYKKRGPQYHWLLDLFKRMGLPILSGMAEALKLLNRDRIRVLNDQKTEKAKRQKRTAKSKHWGEERHQRKAWGDQQKLVHSCGPEPKDEGTPTRTRKGQSRKIFSDTGCEASSAGKRPCKCGSLVHSRTIYISVHTTNNFIDETANT